MSKNIIFCILFGLGSLSAQSFHGKINPYPSSPVNLTQQDTLKILAVMVEFAEDRDAATFGNGKFGSIYSRDYGTTIIDPLPHDRTYFENHLLFVKNYFTKVSGGMMNINYFVLPDTVTVSKTMRNYSPPPNSNELTPVAEFAKEVWFKADSINPAFPFSDYDVFLIFHAGVGRDISLPGSLGNERDLPSVYLSPAALNKIYPGFTGFPVNSGNTIMNSAVIPETESRELSSFGSTFLFEISINGLLAATIASHLGLPDLFDTETGLSAIGRFGLMDGQSIFAYMGLFPPEPSAWEKIFLGWEVPGEAEFDINNYSLTAPAIAGLTDTTILKINISSSEYFLLENRQRDVNTNGAVVTYISNGEILTRVFTKDTTGFYSYSVDSLEGVIVDVDEFDWALPGNGIVIWHIDENIINQKIADNKINSDMNRRGVDVEEADGVQDIGVRFQTIFGDVIVGEGEQRDMWFAGNDATLFKNRFSSDTRPDTKTNTGANSLITIQNFSPNANRMSFDVIYGDSVIKPVTAVRLNLPSGNIELNNIKNSNLFSVVTSDNNVNIYDESGMLHNTLTDFSSTKTASYFSGDSIFIAGINRDLNIYVAAGISAPINLKITSAAHFTTPPVLINSGEKLFAGNNNGMIYIINLPDMSIDSVEYAGISGIQQIAADGEFYAFIARKGNGFVYLDKERREVALGYPPGEIVLTKNSSGQYVSIVSGPGKRDIIIEGRLTSSVTLNNVNNNLSLALSDIRQDGNNYFLSSDGSEFKVYNINGFPAENFPFRDSQGEIFDEFILSADFEGDNASEIITSTRDGRITAIDGRSGKMVTGFPVSAGVRLKGSPVIYNNGSTKLAVIDSAGNFYIWNISSIPGKFYWSEKYGNSGNSSFIPAAQNDNYVNAFFPKEKVYNYPNPVYDGRTFIRFYVSENSKINIKIFDIAGALVDELNTDASGGTDGEVLWNAQNVQSGVYLARVEAAGSGGKTETSIIKIAVVK
jgi:hypothetical protein